MRLRFAFVPLLLLFFASVALGDVVTLNDGTKLEGRVVPQGEKYWIKLTSGETKIVLKSDVASITKGAASAAPTVAPTPAAPTVSAPGGASPSPAVASAAMSFA